LIPLREVVLVRINFFASTTTILDGSFWFGIPKTLCHRIVDVFLKRFPRVFKSEWVKFPTRDEMAEMAKEFKAIKGVPAVIGAIDRTHIQIWGMDAHRAEYFTRKSQYAVQLQITCDAKERIWDYLIGYPGTSHDQRVFIDSNLYKRLENGDIAPYQL
ncbi:hypothetical protein CLOM_g7017, partial [Closterium sp. NIES-68]